MLRIIFSTVIVAFVLLFQILWWAFSTSFTASVAVAQVEDGIVQYSLVQKLINTSSPAAVILVGVVILVLIWIKPLMKKWR